MVAESRRHELSLMLEMGLKAEIQVLVSDHATENHAVHEQSERRVNRPFQEDDGLVKYLLLKIGLGVVSTGAWGLFKILTYQRFENDVLSIVR